jgi:hypothetical protein
MYSRLYLCHRSFSAGVGLSRASSRKREGTTCNPDHLISLHASSHITSFRTRDTALTGRVSFIRQHLALVLEQYRRHPRPRSAGIVRALAERGDERELFGGGK